MNILLLLFAVLFPQNDCTNMAEVRLVYGNIKTEKNLLEFIELAEKSNCTEALPYLASAEMMKAEHAFAPWTKYRHFKRGKNQLESFIKNNPENIEARYIRFLIQTHVPFFLRYSGEIEEDKAMIRKHIEEVDLTPEFKEKILSHINEFKKQTE